MDKYRKMVNEIAYAPPSQRVSLLQISLIPLLSFASSIYRLASAARLQLYDSNIFSKHRLPVPVISVGNLTWGGNGKTPMVEFIAHWFDSCRISPLILTRGYGGADEAKMLKRHFDGSLAKIGVGANRAATAASFLRRHGYVYPDCFASFAKLCSSQIGRNDPRLNRIGVAILDDGMQHFCLWRDLEIVMLNGMSPWGNHEIIPLGPLREPLSALSRADVVVVHHADLISELSLKVIESKIRGLDDSIPVYLSAMIPSHFFKVGKVSCRLPLEVICNMNVLCVSAIGSPSSFIQRIEKMKPLHITRLDYSDHHHFQIQDIDMITMRLRSIQDKFGSKPVVVTTEKDYDRDPQILKSLDPFDVLVLCSKLQILPHRGCSEASFKKLLMACWS